MHRHPCAVFALKRIWRGPLVRGEPSAWKPRMLKLVSQGTGELDFLYDDGKGTSWSSLDPLRKVKRN